jgi:hypothetical protein
MVQGIDQNTEPIRNKEEKMKFARTLGVIAMGVGIALVPIFQASAQEQKAFNFVILIDQSVAMHDTYKGDSKHRLARKCAKEFLKAVPAGISVKGAIYEYGIQAQDKDNRVLRIQGFKPFNLSKFMTSMKDVKSHAGPSNLGEALVRVRQEVGDMNSPLAVIIISDGTFDPTAEKQARNLKEGTPFKVCWYTVQIGDRELGKKFLADIADTSKSCHQTKVYDHLDNKAAMAQFANGVFFKPSAGG